MGSLRPVETIAAMDAVLRPLGFFRVKRVWNRRIDLGTQVVDIQMANQNETYALNLGVQDREVHEIVWGRKLGSLVQEPDCTVRNRIGFLIGNKDRWWRTDDASAAEEVRTALASAGVPFLRRLETREQIEAALEATGVRRAPLGAEAAYLAVLQSLRGDRTGADELLSAAAESARRLGSDWSSKFLEIRDRVAR